MNGVPFMKYHISVIIGTKRFHNVLQSSITITHDVDIYLQFRLTFCCGLTNTL